MVVVLRLGVVTVLYLKNQSHRRKGPVEREQWELYKILCFDHLDNVVEKSKVPVLILGDSCWILEGGRQQMQNMVEEESANFSLYQHLPIGSICTHCLVGWQLVPLEHGSSIQQTVWRARQCQWTKRICWDFVA